MERSGTIAAVATAPGRGGIAVVRVSGPEAFGVHLAIAGREARPGRVTFAALRDSSGRLLDRAVVIAFKGPSSYTGEDVVEFQCHGGSVTPRRVLDACFAAGARLARRGEFTERAFLNGRLALSEAEAVLELIDARSSRAADDALARLDGASGAACRALYDRALALSAELEHSLDVSEDELPAGFLEGAAVELDALAAAVRAELARARAGRLLREGALVVLAGPPNAGKSSLMNVLLGCDRAIVSDVPGTTRDFIEESLEVDGWPVRLTDTAGIRGTSDALEVDGIGRAKALMERADIVVELDFDSGLPAERTLRVHAKCDLGRGAGLNVSALTGEGIDDLRGELAARLVRLAGVAADGTHTPGERERSELEAALAALVAAPREDVVLLAGAVRSAAETLGRLAGAVYSEDLLDSLFSRFCVGK